MGPFCRGGIAAIEMAAVKMTATIAARFRHKSAQELNGQGNGLGAVPPKLSHLP